MYSWNTNKPTNMTCSNRDTYKFQTIIIALLSLCSVIFKVKNSMRPLHMNRCIFLMSFDLPPLFLVSKEIL